MQINLINFIDLLGLFQGVILGVILIFNSKLNKPKGILGVFLITYSLELLGAILDDLYILEHYPSLLFIPFNFYYLVIPLFYIYVKKVTNTKMTLYNMMIILLPGILEFLFYFILFLLPNHSKFALYRSAGFEFFEAIFLLLSILYSFYYGILIIKFINKHQILIKDFYSNSQGKQLNWAKAVIIYLLIYASLFLMLPLTEHYLAELLISLINTIFIFWAGISGIKQMILFSNNNFLKASLKNEHILEKKKNDTISKKSSFLLLEKLMTEEKLFLEPNLSLSDVSKKINIPQRQLSELINTTINNNFNYYINQFRVEEAKRLLMDPSNQKLNLLGIAFESGFNSKASFYSVFKKFTAVTPKQFKNTQVNN